MKFWIGVVSAEHVRRGVDLGIAQIGHGKRTGLARMEPGDWLAYYSPKERYEESEPVQAFTALGQIADDELWQADEGDFKPWRRRVNYRNGQPAPIRSLLDQLSFTAGNANWGYQMRRGLIEVTSEDMTVIADAMATSL